MRESLKGVRREGVGTERIVVEERGRMGQEGKGGHLRLASVSWLVDGHSRTSHRITPSSGSLAGNEIPCCPTVV